ncbi:peptide-N(4)-(N-acetyl-beta-glucosaminyl)asparagine amidase-like [Lingula anatina]|uniref:Peptide-N(4)-(N-acetyl-beta-glucosaminyl)asparagine amidase n=1 Tax=Lingula anatina TaxID=7574 RepID=A0A1S3K0I9_LINAN|nr:peptide-N(4)-(N-acetyl-beta-glucosaminyl)asparagine amidase-like [Lingula anatina]|eukprot:XP_013415884.1 peptide-N(4)-(N-acetyl-beta-glucosaminyl)asparagine amidase-like [Lingula anatina]
MSISRRRLCVEELLNNPPNTFLEASEILLKFANNVLNDPENPKYRSIRVSNPKVEQKLLLVSGGMECLFAMGFQEDGEYLRLPRNVLLDEMRSVRDELHEVRQQQVNQQGAGQPKPQQPTPQTTPLQTPAFNVALMAKEMTFYSKLRSSFDHVLVYEDPALQAKARDCMPLQEMRAEAQKKFDELSAHSKAMNKPVEIDVNDILILELVNWYKDFFSWVNAPNCDSCGGATENAGMAEPTAEDRKWGAGRVENYWCGNCRKHVRFPRYNHPGKLLETRRGRCGEYANCFTLCCRAVGYEARYVLDWTDHVWTEVYSRSQKRWLHCDTCEKGCDKPLLYEVGWGKKLTYVIAFSKDDIQDVTWRYTRNFQEILSRRNECRENWLVNTILAMRKERQKHLPPARAQELEHRTLVELVEFMTPKKELKEGEDVGRQSGSLAWRIARGEVGAPPKLKTNTPVIFKLTDVEKEKKLFHLKYCCASDTYIRVSNDSEEVKGWQAGVFEEDSVFRKEEHDWKMVYLARREGAATASITWKVDCTDSGLLVDTVEVLASSCVYEDGKISWRLCGDNQICMPIKESKRTLTDDLNGCRELTLTAELSKGRGDVAWQHTQLFRQQKDEVHNFPFEIVIKLKKKDG